MFKFLKNKSKHINDSAYKGKVNAEILSKKNNNLSLGRKLNELLLGRKTIDDDLLEDIETQLLLSDVSVETTENIISKIRLH